MLARLAVRWAGRRAEIEKLDNTQIRTSPPCTFRVLFGRRPPNSSGLNFGQSRSESGQIRPNVGTSRLEFGGERLDRARNVRECVYLISQFLSGGPLGGEQSGEHVSGFLSRDPPRGAGASFRGSRLMGRGVLRGATLRDMQSMRCWSTGTAAMQTLGLQADVCQMVATSSRTRPNLAASRPNSAEYGPQRSKPVKVGAISTQLGRSRPKSHNDGPDSANFGLAPAEVGSRIRPMLRPAIGER